MKEETINNIPLFADLSSRERRDLEKQINLEKYKRDEIIFTKNSESDALYIVEEGRVSLSADERTTLANLGPGSVLGESDFFQGIPHAMTVRATSDVSLWVLNDKSLRTLIQNNPHLGLSLSRSLGLPIVQMVTYLADQLAQAASMEGLSADERRLIAGKMVAKELDAAEVIFRSNDPATGLFLIEEGLVRLIGETDRDYTELGPGQIFGEMAVLTGRTHTNTAKVAEKTIVWQLSADDFKDIARQQPQIRVAMSRTVTARLNSVDQAHAAEVLAQIPLFSNLPLEARKDAAAYLMLRHIPAGQNIYQKGDPGDAMYIVESGQIEIRNEQGSVIARPPEGAHFGEMALMTGKSRSAAAIALSDSNLWAMYRHDFDALLVKHPQLSVSLSQSLQQRLSSADSQFIEKHLKKLALLGGLSRMQLDEISARLYAKRFNTGDIIYQEGQPGQELYFIENGQVERFGTAPGGYINLPVLGPGDFLGETSLLSGRPHAITTRAQTDVDIWALPKKDFEELVYKYPNLSAVLNKIMSERLVETMEIMRNAQPRAAAAIPATTGRAATHPAFAAGNVPPVPVRPVAPPPPPYSRPGRPAAPPVQAAAQQPKKRKNSARAATGAVRTPTKAAPKVVAANRSPSKSQPRSRRKASTSFNTRSRPLRSRPVRGASKGVRKPNSAVRKVDRLSRWFVNVPVGTRIGLIILVLLTFWMCGIVAPASVLSALAAAFMKTDTELVNNEAVLPASNIVDRLPSKQLVAALPFVETATPTATPTNPPTAEPTISATVTQTPIPTFTPTPTQTPTPVDTPTPTPTPLPTNTPTPSIPPTNTPAPYRPPTNTPTPTPTPTPDVDFRLVKVRKLTPCENESNHHIYIHVIDQNGLGIDNLPVKISWGPNSGDSVIAKTEAKNGGHGFIEFAMFKGTYSVEIMGAKSEVASGITPDYQVDEPCVASGNAVGNSLFHASFEVVFQKMR